MFSLVSDIQIIAILLDVIETIPDIIIISKRGMIVCHGKVLDCFVIRYNADFVNQRVDFQFSELLDNVSCINSIDEIPIDPKAHTHVIINIINKHPFVIFS